MAETVRQKQQRFARMVAHLIQHANLLGYEVTFGHATRCDDCPVGAARSLHKIRLAVDLNLFRNGRYLRSTKAHEPLGVFWEGLGGSWGGRFNDGNHYSLEHGGRK